ncbi:MAG: M15 family metallopeptidase [Clostridia bacterium]|nr:M15 family metallopeptidase [Clostridia bacterium]
MPNGFVFLDDIMTEIEWDAKYAGCDNFMGRPADGYRANRIVCTCEMAFALQIAQAEFQKKGYSVFAFDAYRPARAVRDFVKWVYDDTDQKRKNIHYPNIDKRSMLTDGYIAEKSGHSRGSTIDLTLKKDGKFVDMGGIFDYMDELSHTLSEKITPEQRKNRLILRDIMLNAGFTDYHAEWWHFRLKNEPYPDTYFDFPIE